MTMAEAIIMSIIVASMPLLLAALGELVVERSGVLNLGVEGMMIMGAVAGFIASFETGQPLFGILAAMAAGMITASLFAFVTLVLVANQVASGLALTLLGVGVSTVRTHLLHIFDKTGVRRQADLVRMAAGLALPN